MRRKDRQVLDPAEIDALLRRGQVCRLALTTEGAPYLVPLNYGYRYDRQSGALTLYFHGASQGRKLELLRRKPLVGFEIDGGHRLRTDVSPCSWTMDFESLIGTGVISFLEAPEEKQQALKAILLQLGAAEPLRFAPEQLDGVCCLQLKAQDFTVKRHGTPFYPNRAAHPRLIDCHMHAFPDRIAARTLEKLAATAHMPYRTEGTESDTRHMLEEWGVEYGVILQIATRPGQENTVNRWASEIQHDRLLCFGSVHPDSPDALAQLHRIKELGLKGVKLHPDYQDFMVDEPRLFPLYAEIAKLGLPLTFHAGRDPLSPELIHAHPRAIAAVAERFPQLTIIAAHMGGMDTDFTFHESERWLVGKFRNVYLDTALAATYCPTVQFERMVRAHGTDRILFATDCPWDTPLHQMELIDRIPLSEEEREDICWRNAARLFGLQELL